MVQLLKVRGGLEVWRSATSAAMLRGKKPDEIVQKLQGATGATNVSLFRG